jgi:hypothetical protein
MIKKKEGHQVRKHIQTHTHTHTHAHTHTHTDRERERERERSRPCALFSTLLRREDERQHFPQCGVGPSDVELVAHDEQADGLLGVAQGRRCQKLRDEGQCPAHRTDKP